MSGTTTLHIVKEKNQDNVGGECKQMLQVSRPPEAEVWRICFVLVNVDLRGEA